MITINKLGIEIEWIGFALLSLLGWFGFVKPWNSYRWILFIGPIEIRKWKTLKDLDDDFWADK